MKKFYILALIVTITSLLITNMADGQATNDYRSRKSGNWNDPSTWERYNGSVWQIVNTSANPTVAATATSQQTTAVYSHTVSLPANIEADDLLLIFWADATIASNLTAPAGWTQLYNNTNGNRRYAAYYRIADGTEGASVAFSTSAAERSAHTSYRIAAGSYQGIPVAGAIKTGTSANPNPDPLTSGFGNTNTLWIAVSHSGGDDNSPPPSAPMNYDNIVTARSGPSNTDHARVVTARRNLQAASEDPGQFRLGSNVAWAANTIAIRSAGTVGAIPTSAVNAITIRNGHTVTVTANVTADQVTVQAGGQLTINNGLTLTIANGAGTDLVVDGSIVNSGTITTTGTVAFNDGSHMNMQETAEIYQQLPGQLALLVLLQELQVPFQEVLH